MNSDSIIERFQNLQKERERLKERLVELQTTQNHYKAELEKHTSFLKSEYGVASFSEAKELEKKMKEKAESEISRIESMIAEFDSKERSA